MDDRPLVITDNEVVLDEVLQIAAAVAVDVTHTREPSSRSAWRSARLVVVDTAQLAAAVLARLPRRPGVIAVAVDQPDSATWEHCVRLGVERTVMLGADDSQLVEAFADRGDGDPGGGRHIAVVGACGGAGASVFAAALAVTTTRSGRSALLVDGDRWGAGLDLLLGLENEDGVRWTDLAAPDGRLSADALHRALPAVALSHGRLPVLCHDRIGMTEAGVEVMQVVLESGRRAGVTTVVDLPRHPTVTADHVVEQADLTVLVVPADTRGCFAGARLTARLTDLGATVALVVRGPSPGGLGATDVGSVLGLPVLATLRPEPGLARDLENGRLPGGHGRGPLARAAQRVLASVGIPA